MESRKFLSIARLALGASTALLILAVGTSAHAGARMYSGSLIITAFSNDTSTGTTAPFSYTNDSGFPLIGNCNTAPFHAFETLSFPNSTSPDYVFTIPQYGGALNAVDTNSDNIPDVPAGCTYPSLGDPLVGTMGHMGTTGNGDARLPTNPRAIALERSGMTKVGAGASFPQGDYYLWEVHYANLRNDDGYFEEGGGDGNFVVSHNNSVDGYRSVTQTAGSHKFGGVMKLLGSYTSLEGYQYAVTSPVYVGAFDWLWNYIGAGGQTTTMNAQGALGGAVTGGYIIDGTAPLYTRTAGAPTTSYNVAEAFKWTTGTVDVTAVQGAFPTHMVRHGYDNRTVLGSGVIQMVSPMLSHWVGPDPSGTGAIGVMKLTLTPEPSSAAMLAVGAVGLGLLGFSQRRSRKR
jgi:hypothetical protein